MDLTRKKEGFGHLIKWLIGLGDLLVINALLLSFSLLLFSETKLSLLVDRTSWIETLLLLNLIYFVVAGIIPIQLSSNIIFLDKIVQRSISFISLYFVLLTAGLLLLQIPSVGWGNWIACYLCLTIAYVSWHIAVRIVLKWYRSNGYNYKRIVIVGKGYSANEVYNELKASVYGYKILGYFDDKGNSPQSAIAYLGNLSQLEQYCIDNKVDEIYCTLPNNEESTILCLLNFSEKNMIRFFLIPEFYGYIKRQLVLKSLQSIPVIGIRPEPLQQLSNRVLKRTFDILFALVVLVTIFPIVYIAMGIIIKITSHGSIIFKQKRTGLQGEEFTCYKFRTMYVNNESDLQTTRQVDPRITRIGRFMRRTSIDELPQFFNVLMGQMSVVGPRPHMVKQTSLYNSLIDRFMIRHIVKPGITGWAQISGFRGETKTIEQMEGRFKRDVWYIENWSFILDLKIIFVTTLHVLKGDDNVY